VLRGPFRFSAATHQYTVGTVCVPGIHAVLRAGGYERGGRWFLPEHQARGRAIHAAALAYDLGDDVRLPADWRGYFEAYRRFLAAVACRWRWSEHPRVDRRLRYASILDRVGSVNGWPAVVELKTGHPADFHGPQLAGAELLLGPRWLRDVSRRRVAVYLGADAQFKVVTYSDHGDYARFLTALHCYWREGSHDERGRETGTEPNAGGC
jgi:hypothetical protein